MFLYVIPSIAEVIATQPLDVWKTRIQSGYAKRIQLKDLYRGLLYRGLGFLPVRTLFWWSQHNAPTNSLPEKIIFTSALQSLVDIPLDYWKVRHINHIRTPHSLSQFSRVAVSHFLRNTFFCAGFMTSQSYMKHSPGIDIAVSSVLGCLISHPFDVLKTRYSTDPKFDLRNIRSASQLWLGLLPRMCITSIGLTIGQLVILNV